MSSSSKNAKAARIIKVIAGTKKRFPNGSQVLTVGGAGITVDAVTAKLQGFVDDRAAVVQAQAVEKSKVATEQANLASVSALLKAFIAFLRVTFGEDAVALGDFGLAPTRARAPLTGQESVVASAKAKATRAARGTKGAVQKQAIKAQVEVATTVTPLEPAPGASPAPALPPKA